MPGTRHTQALRDTIGEAMRCSTLLSLASLFVVTALTFAASARADDYTGTWWPDGMVCVPGQGCRYVAPGCELVRVMDDQGPGLSGTRWALWCRAPRGAA